jgi:hypothetical protein
MEVIKTQIQASPVKTSVAEVFTRIRRSDGILGFWAGLGPNITRTFLVCAAELGTYDEVKTQLVSSNMLSDGPLSHCVASGAAGFTSASISTPVDVVKTNMMNRAGSSGMAAQSGRGKSAPSRPPPYKGMADAALSIVSKEGPGALYKGFLPILTRKILWCPTFFMTYEYLRTP